MSRTRCVILAIACTCGQVYELYTKTVFWKARAVGDKDEAAIRAVWQTLLGANCNTVVVQLKKLQSGDASLGFSFESKGASSGQAYRHYVSSFVPDSCASRSGLIQRGDELLEANGLRIFGQTRSDVLRILAQMPADVRLVVARDLGDISQVAAGTSSEKQFSLRWNKEPSSLELHKGSEGLGFSVLDFCDPFDTRRTAIVVRSLVPRGVAQLDGRLQPGDRLLSVGEVRLVDASLVQAVAALKAVPTGPVRVTVAKALIRASPARPLLPASPSITNSTTVLASPPMLGNSRRLFGKDLPPMPACLERSIRMYKGQETLGITLDAVDSGTNGGVVRALLPGGTFALDGRVSLSDYVTAINNESLRSRSSAQMRAVLKRTALLINTHISVSYIAHRDALMHRQTAVSTAQERRDADEIKAAEQARSRMSPRIFPKYYRPTLTPPLTPRMAVQRRTSLVSTVSETCLGRVRLLEARRLVRDLNESRLTDSTNSELSRANDLEIVTPERRGPTVTTSDNQLVLIAGKTENGYANQIAANSAQGKETARDNSSDLWKQICDSKRSVTLHRQPNQPLGMTVGIKLIRAELPVAEETQRQSVANGRLLGALGSTAAKENKASSLIVVQKLQENSPAALHGDVKIGDFILEVNNSSLVNASLWSATEIIRKAENPIGLLLSRCDFLSSPEENKSLAAVDTPRSAETSQSFVTDQKLHKVSELEHSATAEGANSDDEEETIIDSGPEVDRLRKRYAELEGDILIVPITRKRISKSLGITLCGVNDANTHGIYIASVDRTSPVGRKGLLKTGDRLLEVNGVDLAGMSHLNAPNVIAKQTGSKIKLVVLRTGTKTTAATQAVRALPKQENLPNDDYHDLHDHMDASKLAEADVAVIKGAGAEELVNQLTNGTHKGGRFIHLRNIKLNGLGFTIKDGRHEKHGVAVKSVDVSGAAQEEGSLRPGDHITEINGQSLSGLTLAESEELLRAGAENDNLRLTVASGSDHSGPVLVPIMMSEEVHSSSAKHSVKFATKGTNLAAEGQEFEITIEKGNTGLGVSIVGGVDTVLKSVLVQEIHEQGAAAQDGRLCVGDILLDINGVFDLRTAAHEDAVRYLRQAGQTVTLRVLRPPSALNPPDTSEASRLRDLLNEDSMYDTCQIELNKKPGKGLGLSIVGRRWKKNGVVKNSGIFISDVVPKSVAHQDGRLRKDDQILSVNGVDLRGASQEQAATFLKALMGKITLTVRRFKEMKTTVSASQSDAALARNADKRSAGRKDVSHVEIKSYVVRNSESSFAANGLAQSSSTIAVSSTAPPALPVRDAVAACDSGKASDALHQDKPVAAKTNGSSKHLDSALATSQSCTAEEKFNRVDANGRKKVVLQRRPGEPFGMNVGRGRGDLVTSASFVITAIHPGLPASKCTQINVGDMITKVNDLPTEQLTHPQLLSLLKTSTTVSLELASSESSALGPYPQSAPLSNAAIQVYATETAAAASLGANASCATAAL